MADLDQLVHSAPQEVIEVGRRLLDESPDDPATGMQAWAAIGRALYELGDMGRAPAAMRRALRHASEVVSGPADDLAERVIGVRVSSAAILAESGHLRDALDQLDQAEQVVLTAGLTGRIQTQRALILAHAGRLHEAAEAADRADVTLRSSGDRLGRLRLLVNRALIALQMGEMVRAETLLVRARRDAEAQGQQVIAAGAVANLGVVHARCGRIGLALQLFDDATSRYQAAGSPLRMMTVLDADRAEALLRAGLFSDAVAAAHVAVARAASSENVVSRGDAELLLARTQLAVGMHDRAIRTAVRSAQLLRAGHRPGVALQARAIGLQAALASASDPAGADVLFGRTRRLGRRLESEGWSEMSDDLRAARVRAAARLGVLDEVADDVTVLRSSVRSHRPAVALRGWYAEAIARRQRGESAAAMRAARSGMQALDRFRRSVDDLQIRAGLSAIGDDLASLAVHMAIADGSASAALKWAERTRVRAFGVDRATDDRPAPTVASLGRQLSDRILVEYVIDGAQLHAVVVGRSRARIVPLGPLADVTGAVRQLTGWLDRAMQRDGALSIDAADPVVRRLSGLILEPLQLPAGRPVVVIPAGELHALPWSVLPGLRERTTAVHLSAGLWQAADRSGTSVPAGVGIVVGPGVAGGDLERKAVRAVHPNATVVAGARATAAALRARLARDGIVQIAAHGSFRPDGPLRSTLRLADGEMMIGDLHEAPIACGVVVLSSCEGGLHGVSAGGEVLGLVAILLGRGVGTVVAPVHTVPDVACAEFVADLHVAWSSGVGLAEALAIVRRAWLARPSTADWATAAAFTCFGTGSATLSR